MVNWGTKMNIDALLERVYHPRERSGSKILERKCLRVFQDSNYLHYGDQITRLCSHEL